MRAPTWSRITCRKWPSRSATDSPVMAPCSEKQIASSFPAFCSCPRSIRASAKAQSWATCPEGSSDAERSGTGSTAGTRRKTSSIPVISSARSGCSSSASPMTRPPGYDAKSSKVVFRAKKLLDSCQILPIPIRKDIVVSLERILKVESKHVSPSLRESREERAGRANTDSARFGSSRRSALPGRYRVRPSRREGFKTRS